MGVGIEWRGADEATHVAVFVHCAVVTLCGQYGPAPASWPLISGSDPFCEECGVRYVFGHGVDELLSGTGTTEPRGLFGAEG